MLVFEPLWTLSFPDLRSLPVTQRRAAIRATLAAGPRPGRRRSSVTWISAALVIPAAGLALATSLWGLAVIAAVGLLGATVLYPLDRWWTALADRQRTRTHLRRQITALGHPLCLACGYDLRGATGQRCSECGRPLPLMRFRVQIESGGAIGHWVVTGLSAEHARSLALDALTRQRLSAGLGSIEQIVRDPAVNCGDVSPEFPSA